MTSQKRFDFGEFKELLTRLGVQIPSEKQFTLQRLFDQMCERQAELARGRMILCLGSEFVHPAKPQQAQRRGRQQLAEPPYAVNAFCAFLVNRRLSLLETFAEQIQSKRIKIQQLRDFCDKYGYKQTQGDFNVLVSFFQPASAKSASARSLASGRMSSQRQTQPLQKDSGRSEEPDVLDLAKMVVYCRRIDPNYAKENRQGAT